ncbi:hypothetical protein GGR90_002744 [Sphingopyxis italica]|uniref:Uncharacterized protein n=1 Tax=Sphingopyxis italica TaxID=1129133 RepID=A0A7X5XSK5_9SPHN|nr:hypothetical protein [Sphingopyxis italica]NJB90550.1 hypothetical protein [Sphingopyxis italica]
MTINWIPIAELPPAFLDGRPTLLWTSIGPYVGGMERATAGGEKSWHTLPDGLQIEGVTHFAAINTPS